MLHTSEMSSIWRKMSEVNAALLTDVELKTKNKREGKHTHTYTCRAQPDSAGLTHALRQYSQIENGTDTGLLGRAQKWK
jgi:hypothetical protein